MVSEQADKLRTYEERHLALERALELQRLRADEHAETIRTYEERNPELEGELEVQRGHVQRLSVFEGKHSELESQLAAERLRADLYEQHLQAYQDNVREV